MITFPANPTSRFDRMNSYVSILHVQFLIKLGFLIFIFPGVWCHSSPPVFESDHPGSLFSKTWISHCSFCRLITFPANPTSRFDRRNSYVSKLQVQFSIKLGFLIIIFAGVWCHSSPPVFESDHPGSFFNQTWIFHYHFCVGIMVPAAPASNSYVLTLYLQGGFFYSSTLKMTWSASPIGSSQNSPKNDQNRKRFQHPNSSGDWSW